MKKLDKMKKLSLLAVKNFSNYQKKIDYYLMTSNHERIYAFSLLYTTKTYDLCKSGIRVPSLMITRSSDRYIMQLVKTSNRIIPYLIDYYEIPLAG